MLNRPDTTPKKRIPRDQQKLLDFLEETARECPAAADPRLMAEELEQEKVIEEEEEAPDPPRRVRKVRLDTIVLVALLARRRAEISGERPEQAAAEIFRAVMLCPPDRKVRELLRKETAR